MGILREYPEALIIAVVAHVAIAAAMVYGVNVGTPSPTSPNPGSSPVQATAVEESEVEKAMKELEQAEKAEEREAIKRQEELQQQVEELQQEREQIGRASCRERVYCEV